MHVSAVSAHQQSFSCVVDVSVMSGDKYAESKVTILEMILSSYDFLPIV